jgi:hypothetical protein
MSCRGACSRGCAVPAGRGAWATWVGCGQAPGFGTSRPHTGRRHAGVGKRRDRPHRAPWPRNPGRSRARQMRCTLETDSPLSFAMPRELQWVASFGRRSKVFAMVASMRASSIVRGAPGLGSSRRPSRRSCTKRRRHLPTVTSTTPSFAATSLFWLPSAQARTIRALNARACAVLRRLAKAFSSARSSSLRIRDANHRAIECSIAVTLKRNGTAMRL